VSTGPVTLQYLGMEEFCAYDRAVAPVAGLGPPLVAYVYLVKFSLNPA
jgi:hypothetical protein